MKGLFTGINPTTLKKAVRHPTRALLRLVLRTRLVRRSAPMERRRLLDYLSSKYDVDADSLLAEYRQSAFHTWFGRRRAALNGFGGRYRHGTTGTFGCEALYLLVRAARPRLIVETGVLYGASSAHVLAALARNEDGILYSIELGRQPWEPSHDHFVPEEMRGRWRLIIGDSRRELPALLQRCSPIDMFYHDSLHTFEHMTWEFRTALPHLGPAGILASDDVLNPPSVGGIFRPGPFFAFCRERRLPHATFQNLGIAVPDEAAPEDRRAA